MPFYLITLISSHAILFNYHVPIHSISSRPVPIQSIPSRPNPFHPVPSQSISSRPVPIHFIPSRPNPFHPVPIHSISSRPVPIHSISSRSIPFQHILFITLCSPSLLPRSFQFGRTLRAHNVSHSVLRVTSHALISPLK